MARREEIIRVFSITCNVYWDSGRAVVVATSKRRSEELGCYSYRRSRRVAEIGRVEAAIERCLSRALEVDVDKFLARIEDAKKWEVME